MKFSPSTLYYSDGYKVGHKLMLAPGTSRLYGTGIPRSLKHASKGITKVVSFGQQLTVKWLHDEFQENFFGKEEAAALDFVRDMSLYLGMEYNGAHFIELYKLGYLPIQYQALPEGIETLPNIPHSTFINTKDGYAWLTLYLETLISALSWKPQVAATIALQYKRKVTEWVMKTDPKQAYLIPFLLHDFSARGCNPHDMVSIGLGHATSFRGSDTLITIPAARYFYNEPNDQVCINSVNASEHSVSTTKIFTVGEKQMIIDWLKLFPKGILSIVADTFDIWTLITKFLPDPDVKPLILGRDGKLVIRGDSGDPVDIICGKFIVERAKKDIGAKDKLIPLYGTTPEEKGVVELLWDIFGGTINEQGYKVLDPHIGAIYGDSIDLTRQEQIYQRLAAKGFATTNVVLGIGSYTYTYNTRDTTGYAIKGAWFEVKSSKPKFEGDDNVEVESYNIYKDPITDDGTKKSLKGFQFVYQDSEGEYHVESEVTEEKAYSEINVLKTIYKDGIFYNQTTLQEIRDRLKI